MTCVPTALHPQRPRTSLHGLCTQFWGRAAGVAQQWRKYQSKGYEFLEDVGAEGAPRSLLFPERILGESARKLMAGQRVRGSREGKGEAVVQAEADAEGPREGGESPGPGPGDASDPRLGLGPHPKGSSGVCKPFHTPAVGENGWQKRPSGEQPGAEQRLQKRGQSGPQASPAEEEGPPGLWLAGEAPCPCVPQKPREEPL